MRDFFCPDTRGTKARRAVAGAIVFLCSFFAGQLLFVSAQTTSTAVSNEVIVYVRPRVSCDPPSHTDANGNGRVDIGEKVKWKAIVQPVRVSYSYSWSSEGASPPSQGPNSSDTYEVTYSTIGKKYATATATPQVLVPPGVDLSSSGTCNSIEVFEVFPDLTANTPVITCEERMRLGTDRDGVQKCHKNSKLSISGSINNIGGAPTLNGTFTNLYQYSIDETTWTDFAETTLADSSPLGTKGAVSASNRALKPYSGTTAEPWVAGYAPAPDHYWYFRVCADANNTVAESDEGNNCSAPTRLKVLGLKPDVTLWISRIGEKCAELQQKQTTVLKGERARLCWSVKRVEVFE